MPLQYHEEPRVWAETHFMGAEMSDVRRTHRVVTIAEAMAASPGCSIPQMCAHAYDIKAAYNLFHHSESTPDHLQAGHQDMVREQMCRPGVYLLVEDTTTLSWSGKKPIAGLGQISNGAEGLQGFLLHSVLTVRWPEDAIESCKDRRPAVEVIGLGDQQYYVRQRRAKGQPRESSQARKYRKRESHIWEQAGQRIGPASQGVRWIRIGEREADIYEHLRACQQLGHGFVIRAAKDRGFIDPHPGKRAGRLFALVRRSESLGACELELRSRPDKPARMATLQLSATPVELSSPWRPGFRLGGQPSIPCTAVRVWEENVAEGIEALEWILLCDEQRDTFEAARERALQYSTRWFIEDSHKALKTGMGAERLQLETAEGLFAAIAMMSIVALRLLDLRERVRMESDAPAESAGLDPLALKVLRLQYPHPIHTVGNVALAIGRLGGHMNRKRDGLPGWITLWRGLNKLNLLVQGVLLAQKVNEFG